VNTAVNEHGVNILKLVDPKSSNQKWIYKKRLMVQGSWGWVENTKGHRLEFIFDDEEFSDEHTDEDI